MVLKESVATNNLDNVNSMERGKANRQFRPCRDIAWAAALMLLFGVTGLALSQVGGGYDLTWSTLDGGGAMFSHGGLYELGGTIGQADAGALSGPGGYELSGGFWYGVSGTPCVTSIDCINDQENNACNAVTCPSGMCHFACVRFGDIRSPANGVVNLDDILCLLSGFANFATCPDGDLHPCGGNGTISLDDILSVLTAFGGGNPCGCSENSNVGEGVAPLCGSSQP